MADARRAGAVDRGWLPDILPERAANVRERHNIDTNETGCVFKLAAPEATTLRETLAPLKQSDLSARTVRAPGVEWWPRVLEGKLDAAAIEKAGMKVYTSGPLLFALEADERRGFMYRAHAR